MITITARSLDTLSARQARKGHMLGIYHRQYAHTGLKRLLSSRSHHPIPSSIYKPLDHLRSEIRVLRIKPGQWNDDISCKLEKVSLDRSLKPHYDTLSYTWGDSRDRRSIRVNDQAVDVSKNLYIALRALRRKFITTTIWADALCINQIDVPEKNNQVAMMGRIYEQGRRTWVSLGCSDEKWAGNSWSPNTYIPEKAVLLKNLIRGSWRLLWNHVLQRRSRKSRLGVNYVSDALRLLRSVKPGIKLDDATEHQQTAASMLTWLATHDYWRRVWVVQEIALSQKDPICLFGRHQIPLFSLDTVLRDWTSGELLSEWWDNGFRSDGMGMQSPGLSAEVIAGISRAQEICLIRDELWKRGSTGPMEMSRALQLASFRSASVAHDYVYGLRSLLTSKDQKMVHPDYNISIPKLYASMTKILLRNGCSGRLLCAAVGTGAQNGRHLPSWSLDFSKPLRLPANRMLTKSFADSETSVADDTSVLRIRGRYVGQQIAATVSREYILDALEPNAHGWKLMKSFLEGNIYEKDTKGPGRILHSFGPGELFANANTDPEQVLGSPNRTDGIFLTVQKRLGRCSNPVQRGDEVWEFEGSETAFVVRHCSGDESMSEGKERYHLVGPCIIFDSASDNLLDSHALETSDPALNCIEII